MAGRDCALVCSDPCVAPPELRIEILERPDDPAVQSMLVELGLEDQEHYDHPRETRDEIAAHTGPMAPSFLGENVMLVARAEDGRAAGPLLVRPLRPRQRAGGRGGRALRLPEARGQGVATALVGEAMRLFREREATFAVVWTRPDNPAALAVYRHHGFAPTEQTVLTWLPLPGRGQPEAGPGPEHDADNHAP